jgi:hypothetical protein
MGAVFPQGEARKSQLMEIARMAHEQVPTMPSAGDTDVTLTATDVQTAEAPQLPEQPRRSKRALVWAVIVGTLALVAAVAVGLTGYEEDPEAELQITTATEAAAAAPIEEPERAAEDANLSGETPEAAAPAAKVRKAQQVRSKPTVKAGPGTINLVTRGGWAEVYKGKKLLGSTPRRLTLPAGRHRLVLKPFGDGKPKIVFVTVEANKTKKVSIRLE